VNVWLSKVPDTLIENVLLLLSWKLILKVKLTGLSDFAIIYTLICFLVTPKLLPTG